jgi:5-methyltetrahydrofolate--homocysteine methyltransferase
MSELILKLAECIECGKVNLVSPFPPKMKGLPGADELCKEAIESGIPVDQILNDALILGMSRIGAKFSQGKAFVPEMLMSAKAMSACMVHLKPFFKSGEIKRKGTFLIGTVAGDLHDIGKNLVSMMIEGAGWEIIDLGVDVKTEKFLDNIQKYPDCVVGLSALLTTTMANMEKTVQEIRAKYPQKVILIGGAPLSQDFCTKIGANFYSPTPQGAVEYLNKIAA